MVLEDLYRMVDQNLILVFPTEESARAFSVSYVLERKKGILASSVIAFDRFAEQFYHDGGTADLPGWEISSGISHLQIIQSSGQGSPVR